MKRRLLAIVLAGVLVFSQSGAVLAAESSAAGNTSAEIAAEEEPVQAEEKEEETEEAEEPVISVQEEAEEPAQEEIAETEAESAPEEVISEAAEAVSEETEEAAEVISEEAAEEAVEAVSEETEEPAEEPAEPSEEETVPATEEIVTEVPTEEIIKEAKNAAGDSSVEINDNQVDEHFVFEDGEWTCHVSETWLGDGAHDLEAVIMDHNGPENADTAGACYLDDGEMIHVDGGILAAAGITWVKIAVKLSAEGIDDIYSNEVELDVRKVYVERHFDVYDMSMLPGRDRFIDRKYDYYIENSENPYGSHYTLDVTDIALEDIDGDNVVKIENSDENGWNLRAENSGKCKVTLTYTDWDGTEGQTYEFYIYVGGDVYGVDVRTDSGSKRVLRGGTVAMSAQPSHEQYNAQSGEYHTCTDDEMAGITYEWSLHIHQDDAREQLGDIITVTPDGNDSSKAVVSFEGVPEDWDEGIDVEVLVSIKDGGEDVVAENNYWLRMDESYLELWPTQIDGGIDVGETITITPEVRQFPENDGALPLENVRFEVEIYDDNAYEITENGGTFTVLRKKEYETSFRINAFVNDEEIDSREYRLDNLGYWISIRDEQGTGDLFNDGEWSCPIEVEGLDGADYTLTAWVQDHNGPEGADATSALRVETQEKRLYIDGTKLDEMGISWIRVAVSAKVGGYEISDRSECDFGVREAKIERNFDFGDRDLLPGWDQWIDRRQNCYVENGEYPYGRDFELIVTDVAVSDENVVRIENSDENGWNLKAENMGECTVTVTYTDWDGTEGRTEDFKLYVGSDVYYVDLWTESGSDRVLPGKTVTMQAQAHHEQYSDGEQHNFSEEEMAGITYNWEIEEINACDGYDLTGCISVTPDAAEPQKAVVSFNNIPEDCNWADVRIRVSIFEDGERKASGDHMLFMNDEYYELWPTQIDGDLHVGEEITFTPQIRKYSGSEGDEYNVVPSDQVKFEPEIYDENAYMLTENGDGTYTLKRLLKNGASFRIKAFVKNENGDYDEVDNREYWLHDKNYDFWYDIEGNDSIYTDLFRTYRFDLSNLDGAEFELVPEVGIGEWSEGSGFETPIPQEQGWSFDSDKNEITFYGEALYEAGFDHIETRISAQIGGVEVSDEWHGFDVRETRYDYHGAFNDITMLLSDDTWYMDKEGNVYVESSIFPDGAEGTYTITDLTYEAEEDEFDTRDPISIDSDEYSWKITPVRNGMAQMHASVELRVSDGMTNYSAVEKLDFTAVVGGWRYDMWLKTSTGSDKLQSGGEITLTPEIHGEEYNWETGENCDIDISGYKVRYEVNCTHVDQNIVDEHYGGDFEAAAKRGVLWDYTEDTENRSIKITAAENAYGVDLEVEAFLVKPDGEECAQCSQTIFVDAMLFELVLCEDGGTTQKDWNEALPPGGEFVFTPAIMRDMAGDEEDPAIIGNPEDVTYTMDWYAGDGDGDPAHMQIRKANGDYVYPGDEVSAADAPFTVKRMVAWNENINIQARWTDEEGYEQEAWRDLKFSEVSYGDGFIVNNERGADWGTWYYDDETVDIRPDRAKLDELVTQGYPVETTVEIGSYVDENGEMQPILNYNIGEDGHREEEIGEYDLSGIFDEQNGLQASGDSLKDLQRILGYQNDEWGLGNPRAELRIHSELNGVVLVDRIFKVSISRRYEELIGLDYIMGVGTEKVWENGDAVLYLEDSTHDNGINGYHTAGEYFDIKITNINIGPEGDGYLSATNNEGTWKLQALKESPDLIYVGFEYAGGPYQTGCIEMYIKVSGNIFNMEVRNAAGERIDGNAILGVLPNDDHQSLIPYVTRTEYKEIDGEITEIVTELPADEYTFVTRYEYYDERIISISDDGVITPNKTGSTSVDIVVRIYDPDGKQCEELWQTNTINVSVVMPELVMPEGAVFYAAPGESFTSAQIGEKLAPIFKIYSMQNPEGKDYSITNFGLESVVDGTGLTFTGGEADRYTTMSVSEDAALGTIPVVLWAQSDAGPVANAGFNVIIHNHDYTNWTTTKEPTVFEEGVSTGTCTICGKTMTKPIPKLTPTIKVDWTAASIAKTKNKTVTVTFANGDSIASVPSTNTKVVTAKASGNKVVVTAGTTAGTAKITVTLKSGKTAVLTITVPKVNCTGITAKKSYTVSTLSTINLGVKLNPVYSDNTITYKSANKKIATVTKAGVVKGIKVGKTTVTITTNNKKTKKVTIVVKQGTTKLTTTKKSYSIIEGKTAKISAKKTPAKSVDKITYTSANKKIATVTAKGVIKGVKAGKTTITVKSGTKTVKIKVTIKPKTKSITTSKTAYTVKVKKTIKLGAKKVPSNSAEKITYKSSNTKVATVTAKGVVKGIKKGKVTITIKSGSVTKKVTVTVK